MLSHANLASGAYQAFPVVRLCRKLAGEEDFDSSLEKVAGRGISATDGLGPGAAPPAVETGGEHTRVVEHNQVIWAENTWKITECTVEPLAGAAVEVEHTGGCTVGEGFLGNAVGGEIEVEIGDKHAG